MLYKPPKYFVLLFVTLTSPYIFKGQSLADRVIIIKNTYTGSIMWENEIGPDPEKLYETNQWVIKKKRNKYILNGKSIDRLVISELVNAINDPANIDNSLAKYEIDTTWIKENPDKLLDYDSAKHKIAWNKEQRTHIYPQLTDMNNYRESFDYYLEGGCCYTMHINYRSEFIIKLFTNDILIRELKSRKLIGGFKMPWTNIQKDTIYNYEIEKSLGKIIPDIKTSKKLLVGKELMKYLADKIIDRNMRILYRLSAYTYIKEIEELKSDFNIIGFEQIYGYGRYIWDDGPALRITLKNPEMLPNVDLMFIPSMRNNTIFSRDSLKKDYKENVSRIQQIQFITDYLKTHPKARLDIYYFNDKGINEYNIDGVNRDSSRWKQHDKYLEGLKFYEKNKIKPPFDLEEAIKVSERVDCGCNYRFERRFIEKAIFFEINDEYNNNSVWFLLPDDTVLLYLMQGKKVLQFDYTEFGKWPGIQFPCIRFDTKGAILKKK